MAQSAIAVIALVALLSLELWSSVAKLSDKGPGKAHANKLVIALVEFHKAQCYFSGVIQITALSLFHNSRKGTIASMNTYTYITAGHYEDYFDTSVLIVLASSGLIPISLVLACITRYGRQSWYLLVLSWITIILASTTLIASYYWAHKFAKNEGAYDNNLSYEWDYGNNYGAENSCLIPGYLGDTVIPLCGNSKLLDNALPSGTVANWWSWLVWANCIIWMFFCVGKKCYDANRFSSFREKIEVLARRFFWVRFIAKEGKAHRTWILVSIIPWSLCFASQFYLFSAYFDHRVISYKWSFGQIIALFVWVPSIVEFIYLELSKYLAP